MHPIHICGHLVFHLSTIYVYNYDGMHADLSSSGIWRGIYCCNFVYYVTIAYILSRYPRSC